jgi:cytochrome bd-type quinol oxidase subunit 2
MALAQRGGAMCASAPTPMNNPAMIVLSFRFATRRGAGGFKKRQQQEAIMPLSAWIILGLIASLFSSLFPSLFPSSVLTGTLVEVGVSEFLGLAVLSMAYYAVSRYAGQH